ncbi:MAG: extracellular solute-binding protein [Treponema sp.]|jgi:putative aldouronate transport system substrate-binding protein|nr:extracellular solute-binding protein [Treponema sp.]
MKKILKKTLVSFMTVVVLLSVIGCKKDVPKTDDVVQLTLFIDVTGYSPQYKAWDGARIPEEVQKKLGVRLTTNDATVGGSEELNLMVAAGDMPDLVCVFYNDGPFSVLSESNLVVDMMPLIKEHAPEFYDYMGEGYWNFYKSNSGVNNYFVNWAFYPNAADKYAALGTWNRVPFSRVDIWNALGEPDITTPEKFLQHLREVRERYPDVKPFLASPVTTLTLGHNNHVGLNFLQTMFGIEAFYEKPDGSIMAAYNHPQYIEFITFMNDMAREGFITRDDLAATNEQFTSAHERGDVYMYIDAVDFLRYPPTGNPNVSYQAAPVFETTAGCPQAAIAGWTTFISKKSKNPEAAIKLIAYLAMQEGDRLNQWGQEGVDWEWNADGSPVYTDWYREQTAQSNDEYLRKRGGFHFSMNWGDHEWVSLNVPGELPHMRRSRDLYQDYFFARLNFLSLDPAGNIPEAIIFQQVKDYWLQAIPQVVLASSREEALTRFDNLKTTLSSMGINDVEKYWTTKSNRIVNAFGRDNLVLKGADNAIYHKFFD